MKRTIEQTQEAVQENVSSIFTKDDVLELLRNIEQTSPNISDETKESIISDIMQSLEYESDNFIEKDSIRLEIDSNNYVSVDYVDIDFDVIKNVVRDVILNADFETN
jgi:hypothetical protein